jgi:hypothetical protein
LWFRHAPCGSALQDDWAGGGFLLRVLGHEALGEALNSTLDMTLSELAAAVKPHFGELVRLFDPSRVQDTYSRLDAIYKRNAVRFEMVRE